MNQTLASTNVFSFGPFALDIHRGTLSRGGDQVFLRPKAFSLIHHLAQNMGRVVPKAELLDAVWPGIYVTEDSLTQTIREIRKAIGDSEQHIVRTVARRGYMLIAEPVTEPARDDSSQPVVAVLRFRNDGPNPADQNLVDGFASDIINGLAGFGSVTVLSRHSSFQFESFGEPNAAADRIGAHYLVEGSVRPGAKTLITVNLADAKTMRHVWGDRYETEDVALLEVQREIATQIVNRLVNRIHEQALTRSAMRPPEDLAAYHLVIQGSAALLSYTDGAPTSTQELFERAIEKDPGYALGYSGLAWAKLVIGGFARARPAILIEVEALARKAIALAPDQSRAYHVLALAELYQRQFQRAEADLRTSLEINRYDADGLDHMGHLLTLRGRAMEGLKWIDRAIRLNPIHPHWYEYDRALALYLIGEYRAAIDAVVDHPRLAPWVRTRLAASHAQLDELDAARAHMLRVRTDYPAFSVDDYAVRGFPFEHESDREHLAEGIGKAMAAAGL